ncbi:MAG: RluA family pseudouridine synthase [bacterium]
MKEEILVVPGDDARIRIDRWLAERLPGLSRSKIQQLVKSGDITVDGHRVEPDHKTAPGMTISVFVAAPPALELNPEAIPLDILYEDQDLLVINKKPGMVVHPAVGHYSGTLVNALLHHCRDLPGSAEGLRPGIVHRLDKNTSGVLVAAKNEAAMARLCKQFKDRKVEKEYLAVVWGKPRQGYGRIETRIGRSSHDRKKMAVHRLSGRLAVSVYETIEVLGMGMALLRVRIETGRTHQIRVHLAHIGHPVVGDVDYGRKKKAAMLVAVDRQMLHAGVLAFNHPVTAKRMEFVAPVPDDMQRLIVAARAELKKTTDHKS